MSEREGNARWHDIAYHWLSAPLLITIVGALLINLVFPQITRKSENHRRALDVKTSLVSDMSESVARALMTARLVATDVIPKTGTKAQAPFNSGLQNWQVEQAKLGTELEAYFPGTEIGPEWKSYAEIVTDVYFLSATGVEDRKDRIARLRTALRTRRWCAAKPAINWETLDSENQRTPRSLRFHLSYVALNSCVLARGDDLVRLVLSRSPSGF
jgi:hypothetical protein